MESTALPGCWIQGPRDAKEAVLYCSSQITPSFPRGVFHRYPVSCLCPPPLSACSPHARACACACGQNHRVMSFPTVHPRTSFSFFLLFRIPTLSCKPPKGLHYWKEQYYPPAGFQIPTLLFTSYATLGEIVQFLCASVSSSVMEVRPYGQNEISVVKEPLTASRPCVQGGAGYPFLCPPSLQRELAQTE